MEIKAVDVAKLRKMTGAGMMDCKKALVEADGDFERAQELIRERGKLVAAKRADRETSEGAVIAKANKDNTKGVLVSLGCETDFVANNADFKELAEGIAEIALTSFPVDKEALAATKIGDQNIEEALIQQTGKSGEKHALACYYKLEAPYVALYNHMTGKVSTIVGFNKEVPTEVGKDIAMQITAMNPVSVSRNDCPQATIDKEMLIYREQILMEGKPENMVEKIAEGKLNKFFKEQTLLDQEFVKEGKISVADYLKRVAPGATVTGFYRFSLTD